MGKFGYYRCTKNHLNLSAGITENLFLNFLDELRPDETMALVKGVFRDIWKRRHKQSQDALHSLQERQKALNERNMKLLEAKLCGQVDDEDFREFSRRLKTELAGIQAELFAAEGQAVEIDVAFDFVEHLLWNIRNLWIDSGFEAKQRIQNAMFPKGLIVSKEGVGTPLSSSF